MRSIRYRLLVLVLSTLLLIWIVLTSFTWWRTTAEINEVFDAQLIQIARLLAISTLHESAEQDLEEYESDLRKQEYEFPVIFQVWSGEGELLVRGPEAPRAPLSQNTTDGYSTGFFSDQEWRVLTLSLKDKLYRIQVAHAQSLRDDLILKFVLNALKPALFAFPLILLFWYQIDKGLAPLRWVAKQISGRTPANLERVPTTHVPAEVSVLVNEINTLFSLLRKAIERHRRFTANAAHELRTPIAGAITQVHAALHAGNEQERQRALKQTEKGLKLLGHKLEQLLTLARMEPEKISNSFSLLDLNNIAEDVLSVLSPKALKKGVEIQLQTEGQVSLKGSRELIDIMINNLLENAIQATPAGGEVIFRTGSTLNHVYLAIEDTGPGVPDEEKKRIFDRYHRLPYTNGSGSGLGLSIVQTIVEVHGATLSLSDREQDPGLIVKVEFVTREL